MSESISESKPVLEYATLKSRILNLLGLFCLGAVNVQIAIHQFSPYVSPSKALSLQAMLYLGAFSASVSAGWIIYELSNSSQLSKEEKEKILALLLLGAALSCVFAYFGPRLLLNLMTTYRWFFWSFAINSALAFALLLLVFISTYIKPIRE